MSVDIEPFIIAGGHDPEKWVTTPRWIGSVKFTAGFLRNQQLLVGFDPLEETETQPANPYHGGVWGTFSRAIQQSLQNEAQWYVAIPDVDLA